MPPVAVAIFHTPSDALNAVKGLREGGIPEAHISVISGDRPVSAVFDGDEPALEGAGEEGSIRISVEPGQEIDTEWASSILSLFGGRPEA